MILWQWLCVCEHLNRPRARLQRDVYTGVTHRKGEKTAGFIVNHIWFMGEGKRHVWLVEKMTGPK